MSMNDPIADMLTRVRKANSAGKLTVSMPSSKKLVEIARIMQEEGYITGYEVESANPRDILEITLKYGPKKAKTIRGIKRISKPGLRIYAGKDDLPRVLGGLGTAIISTSRGVMTDRDARIKELTAQNRIMQPKAEYFDELVARNLLTNFRETAKELGIKEKDFVGWLLDHRYVYRDQKNKLMPYAAKNNGLFEVKERTGRHNDWAGTQTLITPKGRETFRLLCKEPPVLPQFTAL